MAQQTEPSALAPLKLSRVLHAPRSTVFRAWCTAEHVAHWFSPEGFSVPAAAVELRVGGKFDVCLRAPDGETHWVRGRFVEIVLETRLVIDMQCIDAGGTRLFRAYTEIDFADAPCGTQLDVMQSYTVLDPSKAWMVKGAPDGWRGTLDKLEQHVVGMQGGADTTRSVAHAVFHLERSYDAPVARVWRALTDAEAKQKWFGGTDKRWEPIERHMDVRVGGTERLKARWESGLVTTFDATYHDVVPNERLIYTYAMHLDDKKISVSLATMQLQSEGGRTTLKVTEQGAFLDGYDDAGSREQGTRFLLDELGKSLAD